VTETMRDAHQARIGAQIARLREQQGWSQRALARWVGIDQSAVSRIEAGRRRLSADELQRFADALQVTADGLLKGADEPPPAAAGAAADRLRSLDEGSTALHDSRMYTDTVDTGSDLAFASTPSADEREIGTSAGRSPGESGPSPRPARHAPAPAPPADAHLESRSLTTQEPAVRYPAATASGRRGLPRLGGLPDEASAVARDWFALREMSEAPEPAQRWSTGHSAEGKPERVTHHATASLHPGAPAGDVLYDRIARFWRSELHVDPDDGPLPDLVPLLEEGYGAQVIVARVASAGGGAAPDLSAPSSPSDHPVAAAFTTFGVPFIFVNAARPVVLQRFALAHAFAHLALGHGDVVDHRVEWSRNVPPEAAANDFAEELLAPVRAVQRWYERRSTQRWVGLEDLIDLGNAFGISAWAALYRSRAAQRLQGKQFHVLKVELQRHEWEVLPRQAYLGGLRDTLAHLTPREVLPPGAYGGPAVLRVPAAMRAWALTALRSGRLSLEDAAAMLRLEPGALAEHLERLGLG
jgi:transcriptional regulator with XRE-family HTH domain